MKTILSILVLAWITAGTAQAQFSGSPMDSGLHRVGAERFSPHYYTVRNIFRNHRFLQSAQDAMSNGFLASDRIPLSDVQLESDVIFQGGTYEFRARIQGSMSEVHLRKRDGRWILEVRDGFEGPGGSIYQLQR